MADDREDRIRKRAHALWEQNGRPEGRHEEHWQQASQEAEDGPAGPQHDNAPVPDGNEPAGKSLDEIATGEHQGP